MCTDHTEVQAMVARVRDRRIITYGFIRRPMPALSTQPSLRRRHFNVVFRDRRKETETTSRVLAAHAGRTQCLECGRPR